ncbi:unnamed protein product [Cuscuta europaea]|uniref:Uncharacterized protein n=1 Tax=Cuscuta europaea TaxID=41803 RepID=A0A9P1E7I7_CUSEU|nr:unnamed protein product [Cuscuta europaea]
MDFCSLSHPSPVPLLRRGRSSICFTYKTVRYFPYVRCTLNPSCDTRETQVRSRMFILGMGFVGEFFAADLKCKGWTVSGTCTSTDKKKRLEEMGYHAFVIDAKDPLFPAKPTSELAKARLAAEEGWLQLGLDLEVAAQVFRLGGIYGPSRSAVDTILKKGNLSRSQVMRSSKNFTSRIHVADICQALNASIQNPCPGRVYNIVDDDPASRKEVFRFAQSLVEKKWPDRVIKQCNPNDDSLDKGTYRGEKRVSNARMKEELGVKLLYSTYKSGLVSIIEHMATP